MQLVRFVRTLVALLILGLVGCVLGCSGGSNSTPEERKAFGNMMKEDMNNAMKEQMRARKGPPREGQGKGPEWGGDRSRPSRAEPVAITKRGNRRRVSGVICASYLRRHLLGFSVRNVVVMSRPLPMLRG